MLIYAVDDEALMLETLRRTIAEVVPEAEIRCFTRAREVLQTLAEAAPQPDVIFSDIEMPGVSGLELAMKLKQIAPRSRIVFVTGFSKYAIDAYRMHISGYVMKPVTAARVREELSLLKMTPTPKAAEPDKLTVRCFGAFEIFWKGEPLLFARSKTKELFAYLVDRKGELCTANEVIAALWEDDGDLERRKTYLRTLTADLQAVLGSIGMESVLIRQHRQWAIRPEKLDCDYYRMLAGDMEALNSYHGEYMSRYSWAEMTAGELEQERFRKKI